MPFIEYEPTCKINVYNPYPNEENCAFITKLKSRIQLLNNDTKLDIKKLLKSSK